MVALPIPLKVHPPLRDEEIVDRRTMRTIYVEMSM